MEDIILLYPECFHPAGKGIGKFFGKVEEIEYPLGIFYIASVLKKNGFKVKVIDTMVTSKDLGDIYKIIDKNTKIVGISILTESYLLGIKIAKICKEINPNIITIAGGPHTHFTAEETLKNSDIDIVVRGEGEWTMLELCNYFIRGEGDIKNIKGITYKDGERIIVNPSRPLIKDLDSLPIPNIEFFDVISKNPYVREKRRFSIVSTRGCPNRCIFCSASAFSGGIYRKRSAENIIEEIRYLINKEYFYISFLDVTLTADTERVFRICELIKKFNLKFYWGCQSRVDVITKELLKEMANVGCQDIHFGVESASKRILDSIRKNISIEQVVKAVEWSYKVGIKRTYCTFMIGNPEDTEDTVKESIFFAESLQSKFPNCICLFGITTPYPGTELFKNASKLGIRIISDNYNDYNGATPVIETKYLSALQLKNLLFEANYRVVKNNICNIDKKKKYYENILNKIEKEKRR
jgi:radical SAM superfamily enzyme YgiQ (UPF0313 family)